jgi:hypothetical protein
MARAIVLVGWSRRYQPEGCVGWSCNTCVFPPHSGGYVLTSCLVSYNSHPKHSSTVLLSGLSRPVFERTAKDWGTSKGRNSHVGPLWDRATGPLNHLHQIQSITSLRQFVHLAWNTIFQCFSSQYQSAQKPTPCNLLMFGWLFDLQHVARRDYANATRGSPGQTPTYT